MLSDEILSLNDAQIEKVNVPEWGALGAEIYVRSFDGISRDAWEAACLASQESGGKAEILNNIRGRLVSMTACDCNGQLIFRPDQALALGKKSASALERLFEAASRINKLRASDMEELTKNSSSETSAVSGSGSLSPLENQFASASAK